MPVFKPKITITYMCMYVCYYVWVLKSLQISHFAAHSYFYKAIIESQKTLPNNTYVRTTKQGYTSWNGSAVPQLIRQQNSNAESMIQLHVATVLFWFTTCLWP